MTIGEVIIGTIEAGVAELEHDIQDEILNSTPLSVWLDTEDILWDELSEYESLYGDIENIINVKLREIQ